MRIAIFGWGSITHSSRGLINNGKWNTDGPFLPIEFNRISSGIDKQRRLTLVISPGSPNVQTLYTESALNTIEEAGENLQLIENIPSHFIGFINFNSGISSILRLADIIKPDLIKWNENKGFDAAIWTDLGPNFSLIFKHSLTIENVRLFLQDLNSYELTENEQYILRTHPQIQTRLRTQIEELIKDIKNTKASNK